MNLIRAHNRAIAALVLAGVGAFLLLLALDFRAWGGAVTRDDVRFQAVPARPVSWQPATSLPGDPAGALLGASDAVSYRRAVQLFRSVQAGADPEADQNLTVTSAEAQAALSAVVDGGGTAAERSQAANLLGVLVVTSPAPTTRQTQLQLLEHAAAYFTNAIALDSSNYQAKQNLELVLRLSVADLSKLDHDARGGYGFGRGHGLGITGSGF